jgi:hypothetical protein
LGNPSAQGKKTQQPFIIRFVQEKIQEQKEEWRYYSKDITLVQESGNAQERMIQSDVSK